MFEDCSHQQLVRETGCACWAGLGGGEEAHKTDPVSKWQQLTTYSTVSKPTPHVSSSSRAGEEETSTKEASGPLVRTFRIRLVAVAGRGKEKREGGERTGREKWRERERVSKRKGEKERYRKN